MKLTEAFKPGIILSESHFPYLNTTGIIIEAIQRIAEEGFYKKVEIADISDKAERKQIRDIVYSNNIDVTQWMSFVLLYAAEQELNLSSTDEALRKKTVSVIKDHIGPAVECGASFFALLGGADPGPHLRTSATEQLCQSLCEICEAAQSYSLDVILEPLDREAHKNHLIGPTNEAVALIKNVRRAFDNIGLCWDSSHVALCGEDIFQSLTEAAPYIKQIHLANPVLNAEINSFTDNHIPIGPPGYLTIEKIAEFYKRAIDLGLLVEHKLSVALEVRTPKDDDPWDTIAECTRQFQQSWSLYEEKWASL